MDDDDADADAEDAEDDPPPPPLPPPRRRRRHHVGIESVDVNAYSGFASGIPRPQQSAYPLEEIDFVFGIIVVDAIAIAIAVFLLLLLLLLPRRLLERHGAPPHRVRIEPHVVRPVGPSECPRQ